MLRYRNLYVKSWHHKISDHWVRRVEWWANILTALGIDIVLYWVSRYNVLNYRDTGWSETWGFGAWAKMLNYMNIRDFLQAWTHRHLVINLKQYRFLVIKLIVHLQNGTAFPLFFCGLDWVWLLQGAA